MQIVIQNAVEFFLIMFLGYMCRQKGLLSKEDGRKIGRIIVLFTLPCAILSNVRSINIGLTLFIAVSLAIFAQLVSLGTGFMLARKRKPDVQAAYALNTASYNIGNFAIPFAQYFFPGEAIAYISMFDIGNSIMGLGLNKCIGAAIADRESSFDWKASMKKLFSSVPFDTYLVIFALSVFGQEVPEIVVRLTARIGAANTFLSMFMIGTLLDFKAPKSEQKDVAKIVTARVCIALALTALIWLVLPLDPLPKIMLTIGVMSPCATVTPLYSHDVGYRGDMPAIVGSVSMIVSILILSVLLLFI